MVSNNIVEKIQSLASKSSFREICGIVSSDDIIYEITNIAKPDNHFIMEKYEYFRSLHEIEQRGETVACIYHSHLDGNPTPSDADMEACKRIGIDYLIVTKSDWSYTKCLET